MDFDGKIKDLGQVEISVIQKAVLELTPDEWKLDLETRNKLSTRRPGNSLFVLTDKLPDFPKKTIDYMVDGLIHVGPGAGWRLLSKPTMDLILNQVMPIYSDCSPIRVQYAQLPPGESIQAHIDSGILTHVHRLHVPIITNPDVRLIVEQERIFLKEGCLYELNNSKKHSVTNSSNIARVHLLIDMIPNEKAEIAYHLNDQALQFYQSAKEYFDRI